VAEFINERPGVRSHAFEGKIGKMKPAAGHRRCRYSGNAENPFLSNDKTPDLGEDTVAELFD